MKKHTFDFTSLLAQVLLVSMESVASSFVKPVNLWLSKQLVYFKCLCW